MRVIIEHDSQTGVAATSQGQTDAPVALVAAAGMSGGSPSAALLENLGMSIEGIASSATTYDAGPPSPDLVAAIAQAASSPSNQPGSERMNGGPSPTA